MPTRWQHTGPEPEWVKKMSDVEIVEHFKSRVFHRYVSHESAGRAVRDMRKRLLKILLDGLSRNSDGI